MVFVQLVFDLIIFTFRDTNVYTSIIMGRNKEFNILFDNDKATYFAGEQLAGTVLLEFSEPTNVVRLMLTVKGNSKILSFVLYSVIIRVLSKNV